MLQIFTTLEETAERFYKTPEFIWNLSLQFQELLRPEIGELGRIIYSHQQRQTIGRILKLREEGFKDAEIQRELEHLSSFCTVLPEVENSNCAGNEKCKKNFKILADQIKYMYKQICMLQSELEAMQQLSCSDEAAAIERIFPAA